MEKMVKGLNSYENKDRRRIRRVNHAAKDLRSPLFRMRRVESKKDKGEKYPIGPCNAHAFEEDDEASEEQQQND